MVKGDPDAAYMARVAQGDAEAFQALVEAHAPRALSLAQRLLADRMEAEDMVQEAFTKVWTNPGAYDPAKARFSTWFYRVVTNRCLDQRRKKRPDALPETYDQADDAPGAEQVLALRDRDRQVAHAIAQLPERQALAVTLCYLEEMSNAQAAAIMDVKLKALESLLVRARAKLKQAMGGLKQEVFQGEPI